MNSDLKKSLEDLYKRRTFGIKPGLDRMNDLLRRMGNPQSHFVAAHVAGTNGKGSVCAIIESLLRAAGVSTGLYTSPHLVRLNERIQAGGECVTDDELTDLIHFVAPLADAAGAEHGEVTFFEYVTAMAFEHYRRKQVRLVVLETGMGGRLDATNVVTPLVSVITGISLEHTAYLGKTLAAIAGEKAGIIKPGRPVVCGNMPEEAMRVVD